MKVTPIKQYADPAFPTRSILDDRPELLRLVPKRWQRNPVVLTALAGVAALASSAQSAPAQDSQPTMQIRIETETISTLGVVTAPLVILPEDEARRIICNEAKKAGLDFTPDALTVTLPTPGFLRSKSEVTTSEQKKPDGAFSLLMDGTDRKHKVSYEYVSRADADEWRGRSPQKSAVYDSAIVTIPEQDLNAAFAEAKPAGHYRAFSAYGYDKSMEGARNDLRAQVRDFIKWLKAEGVI